MKSFYLTGGYYPLLDNTVAFSVGDHVRHRGTKRKYVIASQFYDVTRGWIIRLAGYGAGEWEARDFEKIYVAEERFTLDAITA